MLAYVPMARGVEQGGKQDVGLFWASELRQTSQRTSSGVRPLRSWRELVWSWLISEIRELRHSMHFRFVMRRLFLISTKYSELSRVNASHKA